jgi:hypothetical protein
MTCTDTHALLSEDELRRYLRFASVLLSRGDSRAAELRRARHWIAVVLAAVDQLVREADADEASAGLTPPIDTVTIEAEQ